MADDYLLFQQDRRGTLNRPDAHNAFDDVLKGLSTFFEKHKPDWQN